MISPTNIYNRLTPYGQKSGEDAYANPNYVDFGGTDEQIVLDSQITFDGAFSVSFWVNDQSNFADSFAPITRANNNNEYFQIASDHYSSFRLDDDNNFITFDTPDPLVTNTWYHMTIIRDTSNVVTLYINTVAQADTETVAGDWIIGAIGGRLGEWMIGFMDQVAFFKGTEISSADIATLYGGGTPNTCGDPTGITGLTNLWTFNDVTSFPTIPDSVGGNNGTATAMEAGDIKAY